jgi:hypothetical protein
MRLTISLCITVVGGAALGCGRTDPYWWADAYASDTGTEDQGDGDGDGDTIGTSTSTSSMTFSTTDPDTSDTDTTDTDDTITDTATTETDTETSTTDTIDTDTDTSGCDVPVALTGITTKVLFLLDQGSHMNDVFDGQTAWKAIEEALFGMQAGVVWGWEDVHQLGLLSFTSNNGNQGGACPITELVAPAPQNGAAMQMVYAGLAPVDDNPAGEAIALAVPLFGGEPGHLILLTGRTPDTCSNPNSTMQGANVAVAAAQAAFAAGITTRVVEVGDISTGFAQLIANAGLGLALQGLDNAPFYQPGDVGTLTEDLQSILSIVTPCELILEQPLLPGGEELCTVTVNGVPKTLGDPDGWSLTAPDQITLAGMTCSLYQQGAQPDLTCDCEAVQP